MPVEQRSPLQRACVSKVSCDLCNPQPCLTSWGSADSTSCRYDAGTAIGTTRTAYALILDPGIPRDGKGCHQFRQPRSSYSLAHPLPSTQNCTGAGAGNVSEGSTIRHPFSGMP